MTQVRAGHDAESFHLGRRRRADAMEFLDRQIGHEVRPGFRGDDGLSVRLVQVARHLRQELAVGDAGRGIEAGHLLDAGADDGGDLGGDRNILLVLSDVEIGLIERERLDEVRVLGKDLADLPRDRAIHVEARLDEDQIWAAAFQPFLRLSG